jgi:hypothetical protein
MEIKGVLGDAETVLPIPFDCTLVEFVELVRKQLPVLADDIHLKYQGKIGAFSVSVKILTRNFILSLNQQLRTGNFISRNTPIAPCKSRHLQHQKIFTLLLRNLHHNFCQKPSSIYSK